jgi:transposase InsO family protein
MGAVLEQADPVGLRHPISFFSRLFSKTQLKYSVSERECLALVEAIKHYKHFLSIGHFLVFTDHSALVALFSPRSKIAEGRLARWQMVLQAFDFSIYHRPGKLNVVPDTLSRAPVLSSDGSIMDMDCSSGSSVSLSCLSSSSDSNDHVARVSALTTSLGPSETSFIDRIRSEQMLDSDLRPLIIFLRDTKLPVDPILANDLLEKARSYTLSFDGMLLFRPAIYSDTNYPHRLVVPASLRRELIIFFHAPPLIGAHLGFRKVYDKLQRRFFWVHMFSDVKKFLAACETCQRVKSPHLRPPGAPLQPLSVLGPFERVAIDFIGPLPTSHHGNRFALNFTDTFTRWAECYPSPDATAHATALALFDWCCHYGCPSILMSDHGSHFQNHVIKLLSELWGFTQFMSAAYSPQSNGLVERFNATLEDMIRSYALETGSLWDECIPAVLFAYRTSFHSTLNTSPDVVTFGFPLRLPIDVQIESYLRSHKASSSTAPSYLFDQNKALLLARDLARAQIEKNKLEYEDRYNQSHRSLSFNIGDFVWFLDPSRTHKFSPRWIGPYRIYGKPSATQYQISDSTGKPRPNPVDIRHLKPLVAQPTQFSRVPFSLPLFSSSGTNHVGPATATTTTTSAQSLFHGLPLHASEIQAIRTIAPSDEISSLVLQHHPVSSTTSSTVVPTSIVSTSSSSFSSTSSSSSSFSSSSTESTNSSTGPTSSTSIAPAPFASPRFSIPAGASPLGPATSSTEWEIRRILAEGFDDVNGERKYFVEWSTGDQSWNLESDMLPHCQELIDEFHRLHPSPALATAPSSNITSQLIATAPVPVSVSSSDSSSSTTASSAIQDLFAASQASSSSSAPSASSLAFQDLPSASASSSAASSASDGGPAARLRPRQTHPKKYPQ